MFGLLYAFRIVHHVNNLRLEAIITLYVRNRLRHQICLAKLLQEAFLESWTTNYALELFSVGSLYSMRAFTNSLRLIVAELEYLSHL